MLREKRLAGVLAAVLVGGGLVAAAPPGQATADAAPKPPPPTAPTITLITGDTVQLVPADRGRMAATVRPGPGREGMSFQTTETDDGLQVVPRDALRLLAEGRVDARLFNVTHLMADGFGDAVTPALPLIVRTADGGSTARVLGATAVHDLPSIDAVAIRADKDALDDFWRTQVAPGTGARTSATVQKIWLDGKVKASLDRSTAQIGAPDAWKAGWDGTGVKVAVLDTGIDANHPDVAGRVLDTRDFSGSGSVVDRNGHGTHVAATVAGSGAGSNGKRKGVAPGARLLIGKVLDDNGTGSYSGIIQGMQWAATSGAKVVNMSLGGDATASPSPLDIAVNELSASTGTLFVAAAGNNGDLGDYTVGTPGVAASSLTVGAVDRQDKLAHFSSRGPRLGDDGVKPEITAPGVDIVAARAAGTAMGVPVDELYTAASGTSMAAPHVAGAAAILAQQHPAWTGTQIKDALVSTAKTVPGTAVYSQGAGRADLTRASGQTVFGTGTADFAFRSRSDAPDQLKRTVTYTNTGAAAVTLTLTEDITGVAVSPASLAVPAGGSAAAVLTVDPAAKPGALTGWLTASGPNNVKVTTAVGGYLEGPRHRVTFRAVDASDKQPFTPFLSGFGEHPHTDFTEYLEPGVQTKTVEVAEGEYYLNATMMIDKAGTQDYVLAIPELKVDRDQTVVLDARKAKPIVIETPKPGEQRTMRSYFVHRVTPGGRSITNGTVNYSYVKAVNVAPTAKIRAGEFEFSSRWQLVAPLVEANIPGVTGDLGLNLGSLSPAWDGLRRLDLAKGLGGNVRGKVVVLEADDENTASEQAAAAGAAAVIVVKPAGSTLWQPWDPGGEWRMPIPSLLVSYENGQRIMARAARAGASIALKLTPNSPYVYDIFQVARDQIPAQIVYRMTAKNSYRITTRYPHNGGFDWVREQRFGWRPYQTYSWFDTERQVRTPTVREEWVSTGDSVWSHQVHHALPPIDFANLKDGIQEDPTSYPEPGSSTETWNGPVVRPATPAGHTNDREENVFKLRVATFVDSSDRHYLVDRIVPAPTTLYRNGIAIADLSNGWQDVAVPAGKATYKLAMTSTRGGPDWLYGTSTATEWTFQSAGDGPLPLLQVSYDAPVSMNGTATRLPHLLGVTVPGASKVKVETSADEGKTWKTALDIGTAAIVPAGQGTVSLRVTASDRAGNSVTQTVVRAYGRS